MPKKSKNKLAVSLSKIQLNKRAALIFALLFAVVGTIFLFQANAAPKTSNTPAVTLYVSPSSQRVALNSTFTVSVLVNTNNMTVNAVQANLSYPADKLEFVSIDNNAGVFEIQPENTGVSGSIRIARGTLTPVNSPNAVVGNITFKAIGAGRRINVSFSSGSAVVGASETNILARTTGGQFSIN